MADIGINQEWVDQYANLLRYQYVNKPKAKAEIELRLKDLSRIFNIVQEFINKFDVDTATGDQLTKIGKIVGRDRIVEYPGATVTITDDDDYRKIVKAKIISNVTTSRMYNIDLDKINFFDAYVRIFEGHGYATDNQNMTYSIVVDSTQVTQADVELLYYAQVLPKPQGVRLRRVVGYDPGIVYFGFRSDPNAKSFSFGPWSKVYLNFGN